MCAFDVSEMIINVDKGTSLAKREFSKSVGIHRRSHSITRCPFKAGPRFQHCNLRPARVFCRSQLGGLLTHHLVNLIFCSLIPVVHRFVVPELVSNDYDEEILRISSQHWCIGVQGWHVYSRSHGQDLPPLYLARWIRAQAGLR